MLSRLASCGTLTSLRVSVPPDPSALSVFPLSAARSVAEVASLLAAADAPEDLDLSDFDTLTERQQQAFTTLAHVFTLPHLIASSPVAALLQHLSFVGTYPRSVCSLLATRNEEALVCVPPSLLCDYAPSQLMSLYGPHYASCPWIMHLFTYHIWRTMTRL